VADRRIIFLENPVVSKLHPMGSAPRSRKWSPTTRQPASMQSRLTEGSRLAHEVKDQGTVDLLIKILGDEEKHEDWAEAQLDQIGQMGLENYLTNQTKGAA
jgi:bacterioferritin